MELDMAGLILLRCRVKMSMSSFFQNDHCIVNVGLPAQEINTDRRSIDGLFIKGVHENISSRWTTRWAHDSAFNLLVNLILEAEACCRQDKP